MPLISYTLLFLVATSQVFSGPTTESTSGSVRLSNSEFRLPPNSRWREERIMSAPSLKLSVDLGTEKGVRGTMSMLSRQLIDIDVLSEKELRLRYVQNETTSDVDFGKERNRHTTTLPLDGKTILAERIDEGRWAAKLDARRRPTPEENAALYSLTYLWAEGLYPDREVEIGESWTVDASQLKGLFGSDFKRPTGELRFTVSRIVDFEGQECAKITGKGKLQSQASNLAGGATGTTEDAALTAGLNLSIEIFRSIELAADLSVTMTGTLELSNEADEEALSYRASSPVEFTKTFEKR